MRLSISSPIRSTRPSATAESYRGPSSAWAATDAVISSRSLTFTRTRYIAYGTAQARESREIRVPVRGAPAVGRSAAVPPEGSGGGRAERAQPFGSILSSFSAVRPGEDRRMAAMLANWRDGHHRCGHGRRNSGAGCRRAVRPAQAGGDLPQGAEQAAVRADTAGERPRRRAQCRAVRRTDRARGRARAARGPRRPHARRSTPRPWTGWRSGPPTCPASSGSATRCASTRPRRRRPPRALALTSADSGAFAVRARRRDKRFPITSEQLNADHRRGDPGGARAAGFAQAPGHPGLHRGRPARGASCSPRACRGRADCRSG